MKLNHREERGIVLPLVLIIGLLLSASVVTFVHRSVVDKLVVVNRDRGEAAAALARGGVQIAIAVLFEDRLQKIIQQQSGEPSGSSLEDLWARLANQPLETDWGGAARRPNRRFGREVEPQRARSRQPRRNADPAL